MPLQTLILAAAGGFSSTLFNPIGWALVLAAGLALIRPRHVRAVAAGIGGLAAGMEAWGSDVIELAPALLGGAAAGLVLAEIWLLILLPFGRLLRDLARGGWRLARAFAAWLMVDDGPGGPGRHPDPD